VRFFAQHENIEVFHSAAVINTVIFLSTVSLNCGFPSVADIIFRIASLLSVRLSVTCPALDEPKIDKKVAHVTCDCWTSLEVKDKGRKAAECFELCHNFQAESHSYN